jgi:hypothetical protein
VGRRRHPRGRPRRRSHAQPQRRTTRRAVCPTATRSSARAPAIAIPITSPSQTLRSIRPQRKGAERYLSTLDHPLLMTAESNNSR